jgi:CHAD domain-containing protein
MAATSNKSQDSKLEMEINFERAGKLVRKLRKVLKCLPRNPRPEEVHELRTQTRKLEAMLHAIASEYIHQSQRVLKILKPVRKAAGRVRDMDVLIAKASALSFRESSDGIPLLVQHMAAIRIEDTRRLYRTVKRRRKKARWVLKRCLRSLERLKTENSSGLRATSAPPEILTERILHWPTLRQENLHEFRKGVKELRYMLQLVPGYDERRMNAFARVKDAVGDWHDWLELKCVAESVLDPKRDATILRKICELLQERLRTALTAANQLRKQGVEQRRAA